MKQITKNALQLLKEQRFRQSDFCKKYNLDVSNFSTRSKNHNLSLKTVELIYQTFGEEFNLLEELKEVVQSYLDKRFCVKETPRYLGVSYNRAKYFISHGKGSYKFLNDVYNHNAQCRAVIEPYLKKRA